MARKEPDPYALRTIDKDELVEYSRKGCSTLRVFKGDRMGDGFLRESDRGVLRVHFDYGPGDPYSIKSGDIIGIPPEPAERRMDFKLRRVYFKPTTVAPSSTSLLVSQLPTKPVHPVTKTILSAQ